MESRGGRELPPTFARTVVHRAFSTGLREGSTPDPSKVGPPPNTALPLTWRSALQLSCGSVWN